MPEARALPGPSPFRRACRRLRWPLRLALLAWVSWVLGVRPALDRFRDPPIRTARALEQVRPGPPEQLPNIVLFLADDLGVGDLGCYGGSAFPTPNLDRLALEGARFTRAYASAAVCSPSRAGLLTGRYPVRSGLTDVLLPTRSPLGIGQRLIGQAPGIDREEVLLPALLRRRGYTTALIGKWHLGDASPALPNDRGFDVFFGPHHSNDLHPFRVYRDREVAHDTPVDQRQLTRWYTEEAAAFIARHRDRPFFLDLPYTAPHLPLHPGAHFHGRTGAGPYGDVVAELDWSVGEVLEALRRNGLEDRTLVLFTSDNGPWYEGSAGPLRGRKRDVFEGGFRTPLLMKWPGRVAAGARVDTPTMNFDLFATALAAAGITPPEDRWIDGRSLLTVAGFRTMPPVATAGAPAAGSGIDAGLEPRPLFFYHGDALLAVRAGRWKYHRRHEVAEVSGYPWPHRTVEGPFLFDLERDPAEAYSVLERHPQVAARLEALMAAQDRAVWENPRGWR